MEDSDNNDVEVLQNKVHKLNSILATYRDKFGNLSTDLETDDNAPEVPWFVDRRMLSPILKDYDNMIAELLQQKDVDGTDMKQLIALVKSLTEENKSLKMRLAQQTTYDTNDDDSSQESSRRFASDTARLNIQDLEKSNMDLEAKLRSTEADLASCRWQIKELRTTLDQLRADDKFKAPVITMTPSMGGSLMNNSSTNAQIEQLKHLLRTYEARLDGKSNQMLALEGERMEVSRQMEQLRQKANELEQRDVESLQQMVKNKKLAEDALMERDQCLIREKQAQEEISRLQNLIEKVIQEAGVKSRQETEKVRSEQKLKQEKLEFQLQSYREENSDTKALLDRLQRDKASLQDELRSVLGRLEECEGAKKCGQDDLMARMFGAERTRDETLLKLSLLEDKFATLEREYKKEKEHLMEELVQVKERLSRCLTELDRVTDDREKSVSEVFNLKNIVLKMECNKDASVRHLSKQLLVLQQLLKTKEKEYETRLTTTEDEHRSSFVSLKETLAGQQRIASKLKEETNTMVNKLESTITNLRGELMSERKNKAEALKLLKNSKAKTRETELKLSAFSKNVEILESRMYDAENRRDSAQNQMLRRDNLVKGLSLVDARRSEMRDIEQYFREAQLMVK